MWPKTELDIMVENDPKNKLFALIYNELGKQLAADYNNELLGRMYNVARDFSVDAYWEAYQKLYPIWLASKGLKPIDE